MTYSHKRQPPSYRLLIWDKHLQNVAGLNKCVGAQPFPNIGQWCKSITLLPTQCFALNSLSQKIVMFMFQKNDKMPKILNRASTPFTHMVAGYKCLSCMKSIKRSFAQQIIYVDKLLRETSVYQHDHKKSLCYY